MKLDRPVVTGTSAVIVALVVVLAAPCHAMTHHTIQRGESLALVAKHYYGDPARAILLADYNGITDPRNVKPGERIVIPEVRIHRVKKGDTLALIAKRYLNDVKKSQALAKLNDIEDPRSLSPGNTIVLPVELGYTVRKGDSLSAIAERYYGDTHAFTLIALYNGLTDPTNLKPGTQLILPIQDLKIVRRAPSRHAAQPISKASRKRGEALLEEGVSNYFMGDYLGAVRKLQEAVTLGLQDSDDISKARRFLAYSYVALNEREKAKDSFRKALEVDSDLTLDPVYVSPKIIEVFQEVKQRRDSEVRSQKSE